MTAVYLLNRSPTRSLDGKMPYETLLDVNDKEGRLLPTEEEWVARLKLHDNTGESNGSSSSRSAGKMEIKRRSRSTNDEWQADH